MLLEYVNQAPSRRLHRENRPDTLADHVEGSCGSQLSVPRRSTGSESPASVESLAHDSNVKSALCSLASTKGNRDRRSSFADQSEESSFLPHRRSYSISSCSDALDHYKSSNAASAAFAAARRPRRRPIDPFRELFVLVPGDVNDQIRKMGLTPAEIPEFLLCLEEQVEYEDEGDEEDESRANHHEESGACPVVPSIKMEVYTPTVRINKFYEARQKKGCGFNIKSLAPQIRCSHYEEYEADSDDEKFLSNLDLKYEQLTANIRNTRNVPRTSAEEDYALSCVGDAAEDGVAEFLGDLFSDDVVGEQNIFHGNILHGNQGDVLQNIVGDYSSSSNSDDGLVSGSAIIGTAALVSRESDESLELKIAKLTKAEKRSDNKADERAHFLPEIVFQQMLAALERELEVAKSMEGLLKETKSLHTKCATLLEHSKAASELVESFLTEDTDREFSKMEMKKSKDGGERNADGDVSQLELLLACSKREQKLEEEELLRLALTNGTATVKVEGKDTKTESKEGEKSVPKRGRPTGRVGEKVPPQESVPGAGSTVPIVAARRGRPPLARSKGRDKDNTANTPIPSFTSTLTINCDFSPVPAASSSSSLSSPFPFSPLVPHLVLLANSDIPSPYFYPQLQPMGKELDSVAMGGTSTNDAKEILMNENLENNETINLDTTSDRNIISEVGNVVEQQGNVESSDHISDHCTVLSYQDNVKIEKEEEKEGEKEKEEEKKSHEEMKSKSFSKDESTSTTDAKTKEKEKDKEKVNIETDLAYTEIQLKEFVSESRGLFVLKKFYDVVEKNEEKGRENGMKKEKCETDEIAREKVYKESQTDLLLSEVYNFWIKKRSDRVSSLLRCYHNFIMKKWQQQEALPPVPEDTGGGSLLSTGYTELLKLRLALEKARILADRVRRREKLKRDLLKLSGEHVDSYFAYLQDKNNNSNHDTEQIVNAIETENEEIEGEIPTKTLGQFGNSVLLPFSLEPGNYDYLYEKEREKIALTASLAASMKGKDSGEHSTEHRERSNSVSVHVDGRERTNSMTVHNRDLTGNGHGATHWSVEDDRLLLLGVAACGVGRWSEIRSEFELSRNSSQMNQRFTRLIRRRIAGRLDEAASEVVGADSTSAEAAGGGGGGGGGIGGVTVQLSGCVEEVTRMEDASNRMMSSSAGDHTNNNNIDDANFATTDNTTTSSSSKYNCDTNNAQISNSSSSSSSKRSDHSYIDSTSHFDEEEDAQEHSTETGDQSILKRILPFAVRAMLDGFNDKSVWESIAVRYLLDTQNHEKRSGRPVLHPLPIPIPLFLLHGKHVLFLHKLIERPSSLQKNKNPNCKIALKSHKKVAQNTTSSSTLKFVPLSNLEDGMNTGDEDFSKYQNTEEININKNNIIISSEKNTNRTNTKIIVDKNSDSNINNNADFEPEKKSKSKNRKRDRNREREKRREKDRAKSELLKLGKLKNVKDNVQESASCTDSSSSSTSANNNNGGINSTKTVIGFSTADNSIINGNATILGKRLKSENNTTDDNISSTCVRGEKGVAKRTRSNQTDIIDSNQMVSIPIVKKVEKMKENGEKRSHKKKKVEPKIIAKPSNCSCTPLNTTSLCPFCTSNLPSPSLPLSTTSLSFPPPHTTAPTNDEILTIPSSDVEQRDESIEVVMGKVEKEVEIPAPPFWHSQALSFLGIRSEKDENESKTVNEKKRSYPPIDEDDVTEKKTKIEGNRDVVFVVNNNNSSFDNYDDFCIYNDREIEESLQDGNCHSSSFVSVINSDDEKESREGEKV